MSIFRKEKPSAKELSEALAAIDLPALAQAVATAEAERTSLLIDGDDQAVTEAESRLTAARLAHDRAVARKAELERRLADATAREADAKLEADRARVEKQADTLAKNLKRRYIDATAALVALLTELEAAEKAVYDINQRLGAAGWLADGRASQIATIEPRVAEFDLGVMGAGESILHTYLRVVKKPDGHPDPNFPTWPRAEDRLR